MKNISINTLTFSRVGDDASLMRPFDKVRSDVAGEAVIDDFNVLITLSAIVSDAGDPSKCIVKDQEYEVLIRLNHVSSGNGIELFNFTFRTDEDELSPAVCKPHIEMKKMVSIGRLQFPMGNGIYAIKAFVKNVTDEEWFVQSIQTFSVA